MTPARIHQPSPANRSFLLLAALALGLLVIYFPGLDGPFLFDDVPNLTANQQLQITGSLSDEWRVAALSSHAGILHRPLAMLSFAANFVLTGGFDAFAFKSTNLLLHFGCACALYGLAVGLLRSPAMRTLGFTPGQSQAVALLAAALWSLHPLQVSAVLYVVQRMALLSAFFVLLGLAVFVRYRVRWAEYGGTAGEILAAGLWIALCGLLAALSKENGLLLFWLLPVIEVCFFRGEWSGRNLAPLRLVASILLVLPAVLCVLVLLIDPAILGVSYAGREFTLEQRLLTQLRVLWHYVGWLLWPDIRAYGLHHDDIQVSMGWYQPYTTLLALIGWLLLALLAWLGRRRFPVLAFALLFFLVGQSMESSFIALEMVYEFRNYLPSCAVFFAIAVALMQLSRRFPPCDFRMAGGLLVLVLAGVTCLRSLNWASAEGLALTDVRNHPHSARANFYAGQVLLEQVYSGQVSSEAAVRNNVVAARTFFERGHQFAPREFAPMVYLYRLDRRYFSAIPEPPDWLGKMQVLAQDRRLQASDRTALEALASTTDLPVMEGDRSRLLSLYEELLGRYPGDALLRAAAHNLGWEGEQVTQAGCPSSGSSCEPVAGDLMVAMDDAQQQGLIYERLGKYMATDTLRVRLLEIKGLFTQ
ncbi:hypothetical protein [Haliea sp. E17]|uniref:hypothetical protein n=1 Tax=Haliea sp. E17 TaxID=3401576 RepID=UPI003AAD5DFD